jgi:hypothetical protein
VTVILLSLWLIANKKIAGIILGIMWAGYIVVGITDKVFAKKALKKADYYEQFIVNRNYFKGKQVDWQYKNFRFEIKDNGSIYFHLTNGEAIVKTFKGVIRTKHDTHLKYFLYLWDRKRIIF